MNLEKSLAEKIQVAAKALREADGLLITAGAGIF